VRRLTGDEHLSRDFATTWPTYDLDPKTRALLAYAKKLTEAPAAVSDADIDSLRNASWDNAGIYQASALISFFNLTGRMGAAAGLPSEDPPGDVDFPEGRN
jgi:alkylhydroperoxidase family enzyme